MGDGVNPAKASLGAWAYAALFISIVNTVDTVISRDFVMEMSGGLIIDDD